MKYILTSEEMKEADAVTSNELHVSAAVLMERAAILTAGRVLKKLDEKPGRSKVLIACGPGNNGGDGFACARILLEQGINVSVIFPGDPGKLSGLPKEQYLSVTSLNENVMLSAEASLTGYDVIVDALFGISLSRPIEGEFKRIIDEINRSRSEGSYVISIDIPSGVEADTGKLKGAAVCADETLCCAFLKPGNVLYPGAECSGELIIGNIGITGRSLKKEPALFCLDDNEIRLPERKDYSNKGTFGKVLIIAGNRDIGGAAVLSALAAFRTGCGMVRVYTHENNRGSLFARVPEAFISTYKDGEDPSDNVVKAIEWSDVIAIGPGIGTGDEAKKLLTEVLKNAGGRSMVLDADALNIIAHDDSLLSFCSSEMIITPHLAEMSRLSGVDVSGIRNDIISAARDYASLYHLTVVCKDARTVTAFKDGRAVINLKGNNGMATAGSGDVLTGMIAALLSQGETPERAAALGVSLHASAGDRAAEKKGRHALIAGDIIEEIGQ